MLRIRLTIANNGCLTAAVATGHAGTSLACGLASGALRSFGLWALNRADLLTEGNADSPGRLSLRIRQLPNGSGEMLRGASQLLLQILQDAQASFGSELELLIIKETEHGS